MNTRIERSGARQVPARSRATCGSKQIFKLALLADALRAGTARAPFSLAESVVFRVSPASVPRIINRQS
jgi:hypothetical protein